MYYCAFMSIIKHNVLKGEEEIVHKNSIRVSPPSLWVSSLWGPPRRNGLSVLIDIRAQPLQCQQRRLPTASPGLALEGIGQEVTHSCRPTTALRLKNHTSFLMVMFPFFFLITTPPFVWPMWTLLSSSFLHLQPHLHS